MEEARRLLPSVLPPFRHNTNTIITDVNSLENETSHLKPIPKLRDFCLYGKHQVFSKHEQTQLDDLLAQLRSVCLFAGDGNRKFRLQLILNGWRCFIDRGNSHKTICKVWSTLNDLQINVLTHAYR